MLPDRQEHKAGGDLPSEQKHGQEHTDAIHEAEHDSSKPDKVIEVDVSDGWGGRNDTNRAQSREAPRLVLGYSNGQGEPAVAETMQTDNPIESTGRPSERSGFERSHASPEIPHECRSEVPTTGNIAHNSADWAQINMARDAHSLAVLHGSQQDIRRVESRDSDGGHQNASRGPSEIGHHPSYRSSWPVYNTGEHILPVGDLGRIQSSHMGTSSQAAAQNQAQAPFQHHGPQKLLHVPVQLQQAHIPPDMQISHMQSLASAHRASRPSPVPALIPRPPPAARAVHATPPTPTAGPQIYPRQHSQPGGTIRNAQGGPGQIHYSTSQAQQMVASLPSYSHPFGFTTVPTNSFALDHPSQISAATHQAVIQSQLMGKYVPLQYQNFLYHFPPNRIAVGQPFQPGQGQPQPGQGQVHPGGRVVSAVRRSPAPSRPDTQSPLQHGIPHGQALQYGPPAMAFAPPGKTGTPTQAQNSISHGANSQTDEVSEYSKNVMLHVPARAAGVTSAAPNQLPVSLPGTTGDAHSSISVGQQSDGGMKYLHLQAADKMQGRSLIHPLTVTCSEQASEHDAAPKMQKVSTSGQADMYSQGLITNSPALITTGQDIMMSVSAPVSDSMHPVQSQEDNVMHGKDPNMTTMVKNPPTSNRDGSMEAQTSQYSEAKESQDMVRKSEAAASPGGCLIEARRCPRRGYTREAAISALSPEEGHVDIEVGAGTDDDTANVLERRAGPYTNLRQPATSAAMQGATVSAPLPAPSVERAKSSTCKTESIVRHLPSYVEESSQGASSRLPRESSIPFESQQHLTDSQREDVNFMHGNERDSMLRSGSEKMKLDQQGMAGNRQRLSNDTVSENSDEKDTEDLLKDRQKSKVLCTNNACTEETMEGSMHQLFDSKMCIMGLPTSARSKARCSKLMTLNLPQDGTMLCSVDPLVGTTLILCCLGDGDIEQCTKKSLEGIGPVTTVPIHLEEDEAFTNGCHIGSESSPSSSNGPVPLEATSPKLNYMSETLTEAAQTPRSGTDGDTNDETKVESAGVYPAEPLVMESMEDIQLEEVGTKIEQKTDEDTADIHTRKRPRLDEGRCVINDSNSQGLGEYSADGVSSGVVALVKKEVQPESIASGLPYPVDQLLHSNEHNPANNDSLLEGLVDVPVKEADAVDIIPDQPRPCPIQLHDFDTTIVCSLRASKRQELDTVFMSTPELQGTGSTVCAVVGFDYEDSATLCWTGVDRAPSKSKDVPCHQLGSSSLVSVPIVPDVETR